MPDGPQFTKTFPFWVPIKVGIGEQEAEYINESAYTSLHSWLSADFGGWTRWIVNGSKYFASRGEVEEEGYFYQVSLQASKDDISNDELY
ncbi:MAG: hypothetical protein IIA60_09400, partial [Candidatus Marinimicrobia bacterium]|nr:hypothetical protein [Candidatus Neomarinimicrobiota bacterium]